jgi:hypothetical protein
LLSNSKSSSSCSPQLLKIKQNLKKKKSLVKEKIYHNCGKKTDPQGDTTNKKDKRNLSQLCGEKK